MLDSETMYVECLNVTLQVRLIFCHGHSMQHACCDLAKYVELTLVFGQNQELMRQCGMRVDFVYIMLHVLLNIMDMFAFIVFHRADHKILACSLSSVQFNHLTL